jgi:hypothetical protein
LSHDGGRHKKLLRAGLHALAAPGVRKVPSAAPRRTPPAKARARPLLAQMLMQMRRR